MKIFKLIGDVLVDTLGAERNLDNLDKKAQGSTENLAKMVRSAAAWGNMIADAVEKAGKWLIDQAAAVMNYGDNIDKQSQQLGFTAREYQEWEHVLQHYGTSLDETGKKIRDLYVNVANGKQDTLDALEAIGITLAEADSMTPGELFERVVTGLQGVASEGDKAQIATTLFGNAADKLNPLLHGTAEETKKARDHMEELGALMTDEQVTQAAAYSDAVLDFKTAWGGLAMMIGLAVMPALTGCIDWLAKTGIPGVKNFCSDVAAAINDAWNSISDFASSAWDNMVQFTADAMEFVDNMFTVDGHYDSGDRKTNNERRAGTNSPLTPSTSSNPRAKGSHASGLDFVPWPEGLVKVHYGEQILNKADADAYRQGNTGRGPVNVTINVSSVPQTPAELAAATAAAFERAVWVT